MQVTCKHCQIQFDKDIGEINKFPNHFCSRKCAATFNNKKYPKRKRKRRLCSCGTHIEPTTKSKYCITCRKEHDRTTLTKNMTLREAQIKGSKYLHPSYKNTYVTTYNRSWNSNLIKIPCQYCGYSKHVELCHIKPICEFSLDTTLGEINKPENNLVLCKNHHWEFDHKLLKFEDIPPRQS